MALALCLATSACATPSPEPPVDPPAEAVPPAAFFAGDYEVVGRDIEGKPYAGWARLLAEGEELSIHRCVDGIESVVAFERSTATADDIPVWRTRFSRGEVPYEAMCQFHVDLDNYARFTCYTVPVGERVETPGLEALFHAQWPVPELACD